MILYLLIVFLLIGLSVCFFLLLILLSSPKKCRLRVDDDQAIEIVKLVEAHRESLPISSAQGWSLLPSQSGLRCWKKELPFNLLGSPINVHGCSIKINCSAVIVLNVIADVSTWPEWDIWAQEQTIHLEVSDDRSLHGDIYMQSDQLVSTTSKVKIKPEVLMYRFGNLEQNGVGWILLWNAKQLDWTFYLAQPDEECSREQTSHTDSTGKNRCLLTAVQGSHVCPSIAKSGFKDISEDLCCKIQNLSNAIQNSKVKIRPFLPLMKSSSSLNNPHYPTIHSALNDLPETPCVLLQLGKNRHINILQDCVLAVVPLTTVRPTSCHNLSGFMLVSRLLKKYSLPDISDAEAVVSEEKRRSRRRHKHLDLEARRSASLSTPVVRRKLPELRITHPDGEEHKSPARASSHSFLNLLFHKRRSSDISDRRNKSPSVSRNSSPPREKKLLTEFNKSSPASSQENIHMNVARSSSGMSQIRNADVNSEVINSIAEFQNLSNSEIGTDSADSSSYLSLNKDQHVDYKAIGEQCVAVVLLEKLRTSYVDINSSEEEQKQVSGGWVFKELNKDVTVLKRTSSLNSCDIISHLCLGIIPCSSSIVWKTLCNPVTRFMYDDTVKKVSVIAELPGKQKLIHMYNESVTLLKKEAQDFCLLQTEKQENNRLILAFQSVEDDTCPPPIKGVTRGTVINSGWVIESVPESPGGSLVSYIMQMVVNSPEIQLMEEISNVQSQCISNLSAYLATHPPY